MAVRLDTLRRLGGAVLVMIGVAALVGCGADAAPIPTSTPTVVPRNIICSDSFDRGSDLWSLGQSDDGHRWQALEGRWGIDVLRAYVSTDPESTPPEVPLAVLDCGAEGDAAIVADLEGNIRIDADITLSPTALRANVGLAFRVADPSNYLWVKVQRTRAYPDGAIAIGKTQDGLTVPKLEQLDAVGLENGRTYHVVVLLRGDQVQLQVSGGTLKEPATVSYTLTSEEAATFGDATLLGLRSRMDPNGLTDDDGGSRWDNLVVSRL